MSKKSFSYRVFVAITVFALAELVSACGESGSSDDQETIEQPIVNGTREPSVTNLTPGEQLAIGFLADSSGSPFCTATLIDRDVAVTAQHCVVDTYPVQQMRFGMGDPNAPDALIPVHSAPYHPNHDAALLFLQQDAVSAVPAAEPLPFLRTAPSAAWVGTRLEASGYGDTMASANGRFFVTVELTEIQPDWLVVNGWGEQGICFGDSGGPLLAHVDNGEPVIAGVESHGDSSCVDQDFETRLDKVASWIDSEMGTFDPSTPPQTDPEGDGDWCWPLGHGFGPTGAAELKCDDGSILVCTAAPGARAEILWLGLFAVVLGWTLVRRRS